jgi:hypothetical protein
VEVQFEDNDEHGDKNDAAAEAGEGAQQSGGDCATKNERYEEQGWHVVTFFSAAREFFGATFLQPASRYTIKLQTFEKGPVIYAS